MSRGADAHMAPLPATQCTLAEQHAAPATPEPHLLSMAAASRLPVSLQVVDVHQQCDPSAWTSAAATPWQFLRVFSKAATAAPQAPVPLQRCLLQVVSTAQRLQVACPENQTHSTSWSATHLAPVAALLACAEDELVVELCEEAIHSTLVSLRLHSGPDELVRLWPPATASCHII